MFQAFPLGPFLVWTRLVFLLLGIWMSLEFFLRLAQASHLSLQHFRDYAWRYLFVFLLAGRFFAIVSEYRVYLKDLLRVFVFWDGGFSFLGAAIGVAAVLFWATRTHRATFLQWLDVIFPAVTFGLAFSWLGAFFAGHAYGKPTDMFWGVTYDAISVRYTVPIHPVQLYYAFFYFFLTFLLLVIRKNSGRAGTETLVGIFFASIFNFLLEYFRGDFSIPVFATKADFVVLITLFISLGIFAVIELRLTRAVMLATEAVFLFVFGGYLFARPSLPFPTFELRFSQFLSVLALFATIVYVVVHRRKYPHL
ncbi:MAG: prolipoprotein diacylglyceryl transferase [Candidatus Peribacteraceae bacterium]|nr:prolipoprotein diacylglyceryl transferase [Candidatus Peribacteraceae bacterium]